MLEEVPNFVVSVIIAAVLVAAAAAMLMYFNPQRVADYGAAAVYPLVRPLNGSYVWLGAKPAFGPVEVEYVAYNGIRIPVGAQLDGPAWLNYSGGPVAVPCGANVTIVARHGLAARAESFAVICLKRQASIKTTLTSLEEALISYADYVADYAFYAHVPVLSAFFRFGSIDVAFQNIGRYPYALTDTALNGAGFYADGGPNPNAAGILMPGEVVDMYGVPSKDPKGQTLFAKFAKPFSQSSWQGNKTLYVYNYNPDAPSQYLVSEMYRWLSIAVQRNGSDIVVWINGAKAYEGPTGTAVIWNVTQTGQIPTSSIVVGRGGLPSTSFNYTATLTNGTAIGYNVTVALPNCPVVYIYDSPWPAVTSNGMMKIGPSQVYDLLKSNGYDPSAPQNSACGSSLNEWSNNLTWGFQYVYSKPIAVAELVQTPQGLYLGIGNDTLYVVYEKEYFTPDWSNYGELSYVGSNYTIAAAVRVFVGNYSQPKLYPNGTFKWVNVSVYKTVLVPLSIPLNSWSGWVDLQNVQFPSGSFSASKTVYVMPAGPQFGMLASGNGLKYDVYGIIPPLQIYNLRLFENASGLVAQWDDPSCGMGCIRTQVMSSPGIYNIDFYSTSSGLPTINGMTLYVDPQIAIAMHLYYEVDNRGYTDKAFAVVDWYSPYAGWESSPLYGGWFQVGSGPLYCYEQSSGDLPTWAGGRSNTAFMASIDNGWWEVDCYYYPSSNVAFSYRVAFQGSNIYVYRNGRLVRQLSVSYTYTPTAWNPVPALNAPLEPAIYWDGRTYAAAYTGTGYTSPVAAVSYGHIYYALNSTFVPAMYVYTGPTGAYVYQLTADVEAVPVWATTYSPNNIDYYTYANYSYAGYLRLALGGNTTSYDAMYGWGIVLVATWQVRVSTGQAPGAPQAVCTPVKTATPEGEAHMNLQKYTNGYSVTVAKNYTVTVTGCGYNETYIELVKVASYTVNGHDYHVIDPYGKTCGYSDAYLNMTNDIVYCKKNSS